MRHAAQQAGLLLLYDSLGAFWRRAESKRPCGNLTPWPPLHTWLCFTHKCPDAPFATRAEARRAIFEYLEVWYHRQRLHSSLGYVSPAAFEQQYADEIKTVR
ncbi:MAG: IS3 family transposase [Anaerolineae bacterium]|nr:IS3 family transposase [Anaerolineae bacterium]